MKINYKRCNFRITFTLTNETHTKHYIKMKYEQVLYGTKIGEPNYMEDIISIYPNEFEKATEWAKQNGYDRLRIANIDLSKKPDFINTISK